MSKRSSFQRLPVEVDPFRLVEQGRLLDGRIPLSDFPRLKELVYQYNEQSVIIVHLVFSRTNTGLPVVMGKINAELEMLCQRCLKAKAENFESQFEVVLVTTDEQAERLQEGFDTWFVEEKKIFLRDFIEDEILLALPIAVAHDECEPVRELIEARPDDVEEADDTGAAEKENPFAVLKDLKLE